MTDHIVYVYTGSSDRPNDPEVQDSRANQIRLGGVYGAARQRYAVAVDVPDDILSAAGRRLVTLMEGDLTGGPIRLGEPRMMVRRRRIGIDRAAELLGYQPRDAAAWMDAYGASVGEAIVREDVGDQEYPTSTITATLATQINRLAKRPGLVIVMPGDGAELVIDEKAAAIDETVQAQRWAHLLKRAVQAGAQRMPAQIAG